jgi:hypothetical protein
MKKKRKKILRGAEEDTSKFMHDTSTQNLVNCALTMDSAVMCLKFVLQQFKTHYACIVKEPNYNILQLWHAMAQLVETLRYKPEGRGFDCWWCHWNCSLTEFFRLHYGPGVDSAPNRNEYQDHILLNKGGRWVGLTTLQPSCADYHEIWKLQPTGILRACPGL